MMKYWMSRILFVVALGVFVGCGDIEAESENSEAGHDHSHEHGDEHDHAGEAKDFATAFASLEADTATICKAFTEGKPDDAHGPLHGVVDTLEHLPELAAKEKELSEEQLTQMKSAVKALFDGFEELDGTFHGEEEVEIDMSALEPKLTEALANLKSIME